MDKPGGLISFGLNRKRRPSHPRFTRLISHALIGTYGSLRSVRGVKTRLCPTLKYDCLLTSQTYSLCSQRILSHSNHHVKSAPYSGNTGSLRSKRSGRMACGGGVNSWDSTPRHFSTSLTAGSTSLIGQRWPRNDEMDANMLERY